MCLYVRTYIRSIAIGINTYMVYINILGINPYYQKSTNMHVLKFHEYNTSYEDSLTNDDPSFLGMLSDDDDDFLSTITRNSIIRGSNRSDMGTTPA